MPDSASQREAFDIVIELIARSDGDGSREIIFEAGVHLLAVVIWLEDVERRGQPAFFIGKEQTVRPCKFRCDAEPEEEGSRTRLLCVLKRCTEVLNCGANANGSESGQVLESEIKQHPVCIRIHRLCHPLGVHDGNTALPIQCFVGELDAHACGEFRRKTSGEAYPNQHRERSELPARESRIWRLRESGEVCPRLFEHSLLNV